MSASASQAQVFYREVALSRVVWSIRDAAGVPCPVGTDGRRAMPFWSSRERAERVLASVPAYAGFATFEVPWEDFARRWIPGLARDGLLVGVNWSGERATGYDLEPGDLLRIVESLP
jgi:hypothetical protein